jgi:hypothetical protein
MNAQMGSAIATAAPDTNASRHRVLVIGRDQQLLESRAWVMEKGDFEVLITTDLKQAEQLIAGKKVDFLMLCHSLGEEEATSIVRQVRIDRPNMPVLLLTSIPRPFPLPVEIFDVRRGPRALLTRCAQVFAPPAAH